MRREIGQHVEQSVRKPSLERSFAIAPAGAPGARRVERKCDGLGRRIGDEPAGQGAESAGRRRFAYAFGAKALAKSQDCPAQQSGGRRFEVSWPATTRRWAARVMAT